MVLKINVIFITILETLEKNGNFVEANQCFNNSKIVNKELAQIMDHQMDFVIKNQNYLSIFSGGCLLYCLLEHLYSVLTCRRCSQSNQTIYQFIAVRQACSFSSRQHNCHIFLVFPKPILCFSHPHTFTSASFSFNWLTSIRK